MAVTWGMAALLLTSGLVAMATGREFTETGACPGGVLPGMKWAPDTDPRTGKPAVCMTCLCLRTVMSGYSCFTCDTQTLSNMPAECHAIKLRPEASYPDCCKIGPACPGFPLYNSSLAGQDTITW